MNFSNMKILLVGDFMIDNYIMGTSNRLSPEAPVPVVIPEKEYSIPGGAGNVAMNLNTMGADVTCVGVVGDDIWGEKLLSILKNQGINIDFIDIINNHPTTFKQRVYSNGKQVARIDKEKIINLISKNWISSFSYDDAKNYQACILSDYNKGVITNANINTNYLIVDPKKNDFSAYKGANIITPNLNELRAATKIKLQDDNSIVTASNHLIKKYNFNYIVAKKGAAGMTIVGKNDFVRHIKPHPVQNPDVTGAGDTVVSALSLSYAKTQDIELAANFANSAAATAVSKSGTAAVTINEINNYIKANK